MVGLLIVVAIFVSLYTVFMPILTLDVKHLKYGLLLLGLLSVVAFVLHLAHMV